MSVFTRRNRVEPDILHEDMTSVAVLEPEHTSVAVMERAKAAIEPITIPPNTKEISRKVQRLIRERESLFGIEAEARFALDQEINDLQRLTNKVAAFTQLPSFRRKLSNEVLTWRKPEVFDAEIAYIPLPAVGLFSLNENRLFLTCQSGLRASWEPRLPKSLSEYYADVIREMDKLTRRDGFNRYQATLTAAFSGIIPPDTKLKIREAQASNVFSDIRVLAETHWAIDVAPIPYHADPIVVGLIEDEMWVIDVFDPTPLEDYIAKEFVA